MGFFTKDSEPTTYQEAIRLWESPPRKYKNDFEYKLRRGRQAFDFGLQMIEQGQLQGKEASMWINCGVIIVNWYREGMGCAVNEVESCKCLRLLIKNGGRLANENKITVSDYALLVLSWELLGDYLMDGIGDKKDYGFAKSLYGMVLVNTELFVNGEEYKKKITEKQERAFQCMLDEIGS